MKSHISENVYLMTKRIAIVQSNYIPWIGYFQLINSVDEFVLFDDVQFTRRDWRNRNKIKTSNGAQWLTIPVESKGNYFQKIKDVRVVDSNWRGNHWANIKNNYNKAPFFDEIAEILNSPYHLDNSINLSEINYQFILAINEYVGVKTKLSWSSDYHLEDERSERLASIALQAGASTYVSGPSAKSYLDIEPFESNGLSVEWFNYGKYDAYPQLWGDFIPDLSIIDLLMNSGAKSRELFTHEKQ